MPLLSCKLCRTAVDVEAKERTEGWLADLNEWLQGAESFLGESEFSPFPCYLVPLRPKHSPQHPILKHLQPTCSPWYIYSNAENSNTQYVPYTSKGFSRIMNKKCSVSDLSLWKPAKPLWIKADDDVMKSRDYEVPHSFFPTLLSKPDVVILGDWFIIKRLCGNLALGGLWIFRTCSMHFLQTETPLQNMYCIAPVRCSPLFAVPDQKPVIFSSDKVKDVCAPFPPAVHRDKILQ
jgi:hypothetical protein